MCLFRPEYVHEFYVCVVMVCYTRYVAYTIQIAFGWNLLVL